MELAAIPDARRAESDFPCVNERAIDGDGNENVRLAYVVVVEEIVGAGFEVVGVEYPALDRYGDAEFVLLVAFAMKRNECELIGILDFLEERPGERCERRRLIIVSVECTKDDLRFRDA